MQFARYTHIRTKNTVRYFAHSNAAHFHGLVNQIFFLLFFFGIMAQYAKLKYILFNKCQKQTKLKLYELQQQQNREIKCLNMPNLVEDKKLTTVHTQFEQNSMCIKTWPPNCYFKQIMLNHNENTHHYSYADLMTLFSFFFYLL